MQLAGVKPWSATFANTLPMYANTEDYHQGMDINQSLIEGVIFQIL